MELNDVAFGADVFVAVHSETTVMVSPDGESWSVAETGLESGAEGEAALNGIARAVVAKSKRQHDIAFIAR